MLYSRSLLAICFIYSSVSMGEGDGTALQYSCLENPMDGGAWWAAVHGVAKSRTQLSNFTFTFHFHALEKEMETHSSASVENPRDGGAWWAAICGVAQSQTRLKRLSSSSKDQAKAKIFNMLLCCSCCCSVISVMSDSVRPHRWQPTRLPCPWGSPGKNTGGY